MASDRSTNDAPVLARIQESLRETLRSLAEEMEPMEAGWVVRTRSLPLVWTLNQLHISRPVGAGELLALAEAHQGDLGYRHVVVDDDEVAKGVEQDVGAAGWVVDTEVVMALSAPPDRGTDSTAVEELGEEETLELMRRWLLEERPATPAEGLEQVTEYNRREGRLWEERRFGVRDERGAAVAITKLRARHGVGWVEDVYTVPEARSRGYARMLVTHAADLARAAGYDLTFIVADDDDWPKTLYAKVGFRPVGWMRTFHRS